MAFPVINHRYELRRKLGVGKFGKVYAALDLQTNTQVAIKAMEKSTIKKSGLAPFILREIATMRRLRHPNIVRLLDIAKTASHVFLIMELVPNGDLFHHIKTHRRLPEAVSRRYFQQLVSAVAFCHARGVFHRDLKPENLLLDENDNIKVTDFGLSTLVEGRRHHISTLLKTTVGTPAYIAPEVMSRQVYDGAKADIWSCGVILFVMMTGRLPFTGSNVYELYRSLNTGRFRWPRWFGPELVDLLLGILNIDWHERMSSEEVMEHSWFKKDYNPTQFYIEEDGELFVESTDDDSNQDRLNIDGETSESDSGYESDASASSTASCPANLPSRKGNQLLQHVLLKPRSLNAFDIISGWTESFLSGIFEQVTGEETRFLSKEPAENIIAELQSIADVVSYKVRTKGTILILQGANEGVRGPVTIAVEVSYLTPEIAVVQVKRQAGDEEEYEEFLNTVLKPRLKHLIESPLINKSPSGKLKIGSADSDSAA